jgi:uncharacterized membrane protein HdeD (DUF308 family)
MIAMRILGALLFVTGFFLLFTIILAGLGIFLMIVGFILMVVGGGRCYISFRARESTDRKLDEVW